MFKVAKVLGIAAILLSLVAGTVSASQESIPGSALYGLKLQYEAWQYRLGEEPEAKLEMAMAMTQARVEEAVKLAAGGQDIPESIAQRYQAQVALALQSLGEIKGEPQQMRLYAGVCEQLGVQLKTMTQLMTKLQDGSCEEDCATGPLQKMIQAGTMAQQKLGAPEDPGAEKPESPVMTGPQGPARSGNAFEGEDPIVPAGPNGPVQTASGEAPETAGERRNPNAPCGDNEECETPAGPNPNRPEEPAGPAEPVGPGEPQGTQDGANNQEPEQNQYQYEHQNQSPENGDPNDNSGGNDDTGGGEMDNGGGEADNGGGDNGGGNGGGH